MQCNKCRRNAVHFQEYSGQHLCEHHLEAYVEAKAKHEIRRHTWIHPGDHVAVALNGNSSSSALLYFMKKLTSYRRDIKISAISLTEGIDGYHDPSYAVKIAGMLGTECFTGSFEEYFGITLDGIIDRKGAAVSCTYCRTLRNFLLNRIAEEHGVTKLALGQTLDDGALHVLKNILKGTPESLVHEEWAASRIVPRIRPFASIPCYEVAYYADLHNLKYEQSTCPYVNDTFDENVLALLTNFTIHHPATKYALYNLGKHLNSDCTPMSSAISTCEQCGEPKDGICQSCRIISEIITLCD